ncbi:MAG: biotin/lipoyl-binding protein [Alloprevotella sp.]|nr:biotin/lipoyl-binding protein [Alloprevotella sp.]
MKTYSYKINGADYDVTIRRISGQRAEVEVNGIPFSVEMSGSQLTEGSLPEAPAAATTAEASQPAAPAATAEPAAADAATSAPGAGTPVKAPLPGVVTKLCVGAGDSVKKGQTVLVLEAMKMENNIAAEADGTVSAICVKAGESVLEGTTLLTIA